MAKLKFKYDDNTTIDDIEDMLYDLVKKNIKEIPFKYIKDIAEFLGAEYCKKGSSGRKRGSRERFRHELLVGHKHYYEGYFGVDIIHSGKSDFKIRKPNFKKYILPALLEIIKLKKEASQNEGY